ncbi:hypothetical protein JCM8097_000267 [Rhodosporidiobolus ruineniae]
MDSTPNGHINIDGSFEQASHASADEAVRNVVWSTIVVLVNVPDDTLYVPVLPTDTIWDLKCAVSRQHGDDPHQQRLFSVDGILLEDHDLLEDCDLGHGSEVYLSLADPAQASLGEYRGWGDSVGSTEQDHWLRMADHLMA